MIVLFFFNINSIFYSVIIYMVVFLCKVRYNYNVWLIFIILDRMKSLVIINFFIELI